jgi:hypothetical protein
MKQTTGEDIKIPIDEEGGAAVDIPMYVQEWQPGRNSNPKETC